MQIQASNQTASSSSTGQQASDAHDHLAQENKDGKWMSVNMSGEKKKGKRLHKKSGSEDEYEDDYNDTDDSDNEGDYVDINQIHADRGKISKEEEKLRRKHQRENNSVPGAYSSNQTSTRESRKSSRPSRSRSTSSDRDDLSRSSRQHRGGDKNTKTVVPGAHASTLTSTRESRKSSQRSRRRSTSSDRDDLSRSSNHSRGGAGAHASNLTSTRESRKSSRPTRTRSTSSDRDDHSRGGAGAHASNLNSTRESRKSSRPTRTRSTSSDRDEPAHGSHELIEARRVSQNSSTATRQRSKSIDEESIQVMGETVDDDTDIAPVPPRPLPPAPTQSNQNEVVGQNNTKQVVVQNAEANGNAKSRRQKLLCLAALLLVAAVAGAVIWFLTSSTGDNSNSPSMAGSELLFEPPSTKDCVSIARGESLPNQTFSRNFELPLDVVLLDSDSKMEDHMQELMAAIQRYLIPSLAGCFVDDDLTGRRVLGSLESKNAMASVSHHRALQSSPSIRFAILNAIATGEYRVDDMCDQDSADFCHRVSLYLAVFLKGDIEISEIVTLVSAEGLNARGRLVDRLGLENPFGNVFIRGVNSMNPTNRTPPTPTASPSTATSMMPSLTPSQTPSFSRVATDRPGIDPTNAPTNRQTTAPSVKPTGQPSESPIASPTSLPAMNPNTGPVSPPPTRPPSMSPTKPPSTPPYPLPTISPSKSPTESPTTRPTVKPTVNPTAKPTAKPTVKPTAKPTNIPTPRPSVVPTIGSTPAPTSTPSVSPSAAPSSGFALVQPGKKCPQRGDFREFKIAYDGNVETCYEACLAVEACVAFSTGNWCVGCSIAAEWFQRDDDATAYSMTTRSTPIQGAVLAGHNLKCRQDETRLFKVSDATTYEECWELCFNAEGCGSFNLGVDGWGEQICVGCEYLTLDQFTPEDGRTVFWMDPQS